ncbi:D-lactate dehydrogenase (cytochrome) [Ascochyta lentis]
MHRHTTSDTGDMFSRRSSRALSFSSDRPSVAGSVTFQMPTTVRPLPAYIAASVASQMVTDNHNAQLRHADSEYEDLENAIFSDQALSLLNGFLDHLLFAFLSTARSPSLAAIRPAISDVLKPRLAREAAEAADEELQGLLSADDDDDDDDESSPIDAGRAIDRWDVEKVWKRTRLRIMVYTRLGEMEDEDEEKYVQQERGLSMDEDEDEEAGLVSWASAIFLTSVVEYVAEQTLLIAGQAAYARMASRVKKSQHSHDADDVALERLVIEEPDVEKIALNSALGRLWRTWRKRVRSALQPLSPNRGIRPNSSYTSLHGRRGSQATPDDSYHVEPTPVSERAPTETDIAANIPLPITARDVDEIEVPGLARTYEDAESSGMQTPVSRPQRPSSVIVLASAENFRRRHNKERPTSMPGPEVLPFEVPSHPSMDGEEEQTETALETPFETPMTSNFNRSSYIGDEDKIEPLLLPHKGKGNAHDAMLAAAIAASPKSNLNRSGVEPDTPTSVTSTTSDTYDVEPKVLQSKRMSIGRSGPPGIVRTFSTRSSSLKSPRETPTATPMASTHAEATSYLNDHSDDEDVEGPQAIGVARTSDVPIRSSPTPSAEPWTERAKVVPAQGGYVEVQPTPRSVPSRSTPMPDSKPIIPERSVARNDVLKRASPNLGGAGPAAVAGTASPPRRRDATPPTSGRTSLPSLQEVEYHKPQQTSSSEQTMRQNSPTFSNRSRTQSPHFARDNAVTMAERQGPRRSTEESLRSPSTAGGSIMEKPGVKRVGSTSSKKSGSISRLPSARDSDPQLSRNLGGRMSEEDRERQFEELVQGKETVKYTLTPENMRALDESPAVRKAELERPSNSSVTVYPRVDANKDNSFGANALPVNSTSKGRVPGAPHHKPSPSRKVITRPLAREPRIESESLRDFADFIRSTGPSPGQEKPIQPFVNISGNGLKSTNSSSTSIGRKSSTKQLSSRNQDGPSARPRVNMEPRSPAGLSTGNDDLIDFIRQGPPNGPEGQPRIPRSVAPFRTTVDSDQFESMLGDHGNVESAYGSKASTLNSQHSIQTSNSKTGLIASPSVVQPAYSNTPQNLSGSMASSSEPVITRTRRRIKDPYAIDLSDEDDEDGDQLTALPASNKPPAARQESLMDFLNEMEPPSAPSASKPQPFMLSQETIAAAKARANSSNSSLSSAATATRSNGGSNGAAPPMGFPSSSGTETTRAHKPKAAARAPVVGDVRASRTATSELADFLRNSGPPEPVGPPPRKEEEKKKSSNMKFWRKNKEKTYGDLP